MSRLTAIVTAMKNPREMSIVTLKAIDGQVEIFKILLTHESKVFQATFEETKGNEIDLQFPMSVVQPVFDWLHDEKSLNLDNIQMSNIFDILVFAHQYDMAKLIGEIEQFFQNMVKYHEYSTAGKVLMVFKQAKVGEKIYKSAIKTLIMLRQKMYDYAGEYEHMRDGTVKRNVQGTYKQHSSIYFDIMKTLPPQVHIDIAEYETTLCG